MLATATPYEITWELLPDDFVLDDEPVDNVNQPPLAAALTESLELAGKLPDRALVATNYGICATMNGKIAIKAPDWVYVPQISVSRAQVLRSYTPHRQGDAPLIAIEFLSDTDGGEYSSKRTYPPGKWFFYEQILQIPHYLIFEPNTGRLEVHRLQESGVYELRSPEASDRYWIEELGLAIGVWQGRRENRDSYWLRWWDEDGNLLLWGSELVARERQATERERQATERERQVTERERQAKEAALRRLEQLEQQLREAGLEPPN
ncbi:Uma2 family endonuclease [Spirulina sp. 06S082]|uniref:Uma2 family endonuclease n=1 Tax=Spirulina sp. 06S082 TaxID=3110248 RepID=UPI002B1EDF12|nr:Uma2 family endonuclease [Spirulina sp. 06S082]MEA5467668.1 Uma2 family endonuclease [Spirulina sp. 06S082]